MLEIGEEVSDYLDEESFRVVYNHFKNEYPLLKDFFEEDGLLEIVIGEYDAQMNHNRDLQENIIAVCAENDGEIYSVLKDNFDTGLDRIVEELGLQPLIIDTDYRSQVLSYDEDRLREEFLKGSLTLGTLHEILKIQRGIDNGNILKCPVPKAIKFLVRKALYGLKSFHM